MFGSISIVDQGFNSGIDNAYTRLSGFGGKVAGVLGGIATAFGTALTAGVGAFTAITKKAFDMSASVEQSVGGIQTLFGDSANIVIKNAEKAYITAGLNADEYMQQISSFSASLLQSVGGDTEKAAEAGNQAMIDMSDNSSKMGTSIESIQNAYQGFAKQEYTMLNNLKLGYGGTKSEMERLLVDAEKLSGKKYDINNLAEVYEGINVIQTELGITGTTAKEASETVSGSLGMLKSSFDNLLAGTGSVDSFVSSFEIAMDNIMNSLGKILPRLTEAFPQIIEKIVPMIPPTLEQILPPLLAGGATLIGGLISGLIATAPTLLKELGKILIDLGNGIVNFSTPFIEKGKELFDNFINNFSANAPKLSESGKKLIDNIASGLSENIPKFLDKGIELFDKFFNFVKENFPKFAKAGMDFIFSIAQGFQDNYPQILKVVVESFEKLIKKVRDDLPKWIEYGKDLIKNIIQSIKDNAPELLSKMGENAKLLLDTLGDKLPEFLSIGGDIVWELIKGIADIGKMLFDEGKKLVDETLRIIGEQIELQAVVTIEKAKKLGNDIINGIMNGIDELKDKAVDSIKNVGTNIIEGAKNIFKSNSPSKEFQDIGETLPEGLGVGVSKNEKEAIKAVEAMAKKTYESAKTWISDYRNDINYMASEELKMWEILLKKHQDISKEKVEIEKNISKLREEISKAEFENSKKWIEKGIFFNILSIDEQISSWERLQVKYVEGTEQREEIDKTLYTLKKQRISDIETAEKEALEEQKKIAQEQENLYKKQEDIVNKITDAEKKYSDAVKSRSDAIFNAFGLFDKLEEKQQEEKVTGKELIENLKGQVIALRDWKADLEKLSQMGINKELYMELSVSGPQSREEIEALANLSQKDLQEYSNFWAEKHKEAGEQSVKELQGMKIEMENTVNSYLMDLAGTVGSDALQIGKTIADNINKGIKENLKPTTTTTSKTETSTNTVVPVTENMEQMKTVVDVGFTEFNNTIVGKFGDMVIQALVVLNKMMDDVGTTLRVRGFEVGRVFMRSLGDALIKEKAYLLTEALDVADAIVQIFDARERAKKGIGGDYTTTNQTTNNTGNTNSINQNMYFYGVENEQTAFEAEQAIRRSTWEAYS